MPGKLLLPSAKSGVIVEAPPPKISPWWRRIAIVIGVLAVVVGAADALSRLAYNFLGDDAAFFTFAPAALLVEPELWGLIEGTSTTSFVPARLIIPKLNVTASVEQVGKKADGSMDTPKALANVAWYAPGQKPGEKGNAVFAGHVNNALGTAGVFKELSALQKGDEVQVVGESGATLTYIVESSNEYFLDRAPLEQIFANEGSSGIALITCEGSWDPSARTYDKRLVVVARLQNP